MEWEQGEENLLQFTQPVPPAFRNKPNLEPFEVSS